MVFIIKTKIFLSFININRKKNKNKNKKNKNKNKNNENNLNNVNLWNVDENNIDPKDDITDLQARVFESVHKEASM